MDEIRSVKYTDLLDKVDSFISLDISVRSTGWVKKINGEVTHGCFSILETDETKRRKEFREFIIRLFGNMYFDYVFIEDVIGGTNFKTTKNLILLNTIVDDLKEYNILNIGEIKRIDNKKWKKYLKELVSYKPQVLKEEDKITIVNCMNLLDFKAEVKQDIYDAYGIAVSIIYRDNVKGIKTKTDTTLKKDLRRGYIIKQDIKSDGRLLQNTKKKYNREIEYIDWSCESRDVLYLFKRKITVDGYDDKIYVILVNNMKLGVLALTKNLSVEGDCSFLIVTKRN